VVIAARCSRWWTIPIAHSGGDAWKRPTGPVHSPSYGITRRRYGLGARRRIVIGCMIRLRHRSTAHGREPAEELSDRSERLVDDQIRSGRHRVLLLAAVAVLGLVVVGLAMCIRRSDAP